MPKKPRRYTGDDMTAAEVEALVAEQMKCLPSWWEREAERTRAAKAGWKTRRGGKSADEVADGQELS